MIATCAVVFVACNDDKNSVAAFEMPVGSRPDYDSLLSSEDKAIVDKGLLESAKSDDDVTKDQTAIKAAVMKLYTIANKSRIETPVSLVVQESDAGISMGSVIMRSVNVRSGDRWYYQLAASANTDNAFLKAILDATASFVKIAYCDGNGNYYYFNDMGAKYKSDCTVTTFPYASFVIPDDVVLFDKALTKDEFNKQIHVLSGSIHEINNMDFCAEIVANNAKIKFENGYYTVDFSVDMNSDAALLEKWFAQAKLDMAAGKMPQTLQYYDYYNATLQLWDNGYAKYFESHSKREAGMGSGSPVDKYSYVWDEDAIMDLVKKDVAIEGNEAMLIRSIEDYIEFKQDPELVARKLTLLETTGVVLGCIVLVVIAIVVTIEVLVKKGKLPKLAAKREAAKQKRLAKKAAKKALKDSSSSCDAQWDISSCDTTDDANAENADATVDETIDTAVDETTQTADESTENSSDGQS